MTSKKDKLESVWANIKGINIHAEIHELSPKHTNVVFVHGLSVSSKYMLPTIEEMSSSFNIYAPDLPGFGKSEDPAHILSLNELTEYLKLWLDKMKVKKAVFLGNSLGCQIIVDFALKYPSYITHAILIGPTVDPKGRSFLKEALRLVQDMFHEPLRFLPVIISEYLHAGPGRTLKTLKYGFDDKIQEKLPKVRIPTLIVRGEKDPIVPQRWAEKVNNELPNSKLIVIPNAGHAVNFNSPKKLTQAVKKFLKQN